MARVADHLSIEELGRRFRTSPDGCRARHIQAIWLLARDASFEEVSSTTGLGRRWLEQLVQRYNAEGFEALGDRRRRNGAQARIVTPDLLAKLRARLAEPPPDGGVWTAPKVAVWMAAELGVVSVYPQRAWEALRAIGWTLQAPRPRHPQAAGPEEVAAFKKNLRASSPKPRRATPAGRLVSSARTSIASA